MLALGLIVTPPGCGIRTNHACNARYAPTA